MTNLEKLDNAIKELEKQSNDLKDFNSVYSEIAKLKHEIQENLKLLQENNARLIDISKDVRGSIEEFQKRVDELYKDNKAYQKELDASIASRLEKHQSDIQIEVRNEGTQIQRAFETSLNSNFNQMESKIKESFEQQKKKLESQKILTIILIAISIGLAVALFIVK